MFSSVSARATLARTSLESRLVGLRICFILGTASAALALVGCSGGSSNGGDPGARALPTGMSCQSLRADLNKMDSQGAQSKVEAATAGKASPEARAVADKYNTLLNYYLGARCHT
jgi:hypothetical protein